MKRLTLAIALMVVGLQAQISVEKIELVDFAKNAFQPVFSEDGRFLVFRAEDGVYTYNLKSQASEKIAQTGYEPVMDAQGRVSYRLDTYIEGRRLGSVVTYDTKKRSQLTASQPIRFDAAPKITTHGTYYVADSKVSHKTSSADRVSKAVAFSYGDAVLLYTYGTSRILQPGGNIPHLWPSVSPDETQLSVVVGSDILISDLNGNVVSVIKDGRAPKWSPDGEKIVFMRDRDNGDTYTSSDIFVYDLAENDLIQITDSEDRIEMYPSWSPDGNSVVCDDALNGKMYLINLIQK